MESWERAREIRLLPKDLGTTMAEGERCSGPGGPRVLVGKERGDRVRAGAREVAP